jgi:hypothetical protein
MANILILDHQILLLFFQFMGNWQSKLTCTVRGSDNDVCQILCSRDDFRSDVEDKIRSQMKKHCIAEMKIYFGEHEMDEDETFEELETIGFTIESELGYVLVDAFDVAVECENDKSVPICVSPSTRFVEIADETRKTLKLPLGSVEMIIGESEVNEDRTMSEMEIESGIRLKYRMNAIGNIFGSKEKITVEKISEGIKYVEKVPFSTLKRIMRNEVVSEMKKKISENEKNEEIYSSLISFLKMMLSRGVGVESGNVWNSCFPGMRESGLKEMIENKVKEIVFDEEKKDSEMNECERDMIVGYSFLMKDWSVEKKLLEKLCKCLILIVGKGISKEKKKEEREGLIGLRCICKRFCFFLCSFFLFLFHSSILFLFFFFLFHHFHRESGCSERNISSIRRERDK